MVERFVLQSGARSLLPNERVAGCLRWRQAGKDCVEVWHLHEIKRARFGNLQTCASVWACPVCAAVITERRKLELTAALIAAHARGWVVVMTTYTLRHNASDSLPWLLEGLSTARRKATGGREAQALREACGVAGSVRALEVTWGAQNGWHVHIHELSFVCPGAALSLADLAQGMRSRWDVGLRLAGMRAVNEHGCDVTICDTDIAAYVEKFGRERSWNTEHEMTKQPVKKGREGRYTPTELLRSFVHDADAVAGRLWREYALTLKGARQLYWSKGLRADLLPAVPDRTDQEVAEEVDQAGTLLARLDLMQWKTILWHHARAQVLNIAATGDGAALAAFVAGLEPGPAITTSRERVTKPSRREVADSDWQDIGDPEAEAAPQDPAAADRLERQWELLALSPTLSFADAARMDAHAERARRQKMRREARRRPAPDAAPGGRGPVGRPVQQREPPAD